MPVLGEDRNPALGYEVGAWMEHRRAFTLSEDRNGNDDMTVAHALAAALGIHV